MPTSFPPLPLTPMPSLLRRRPSPSHALAYLCHRPTLSSATASPCPHRCGDHWPDGVMSLALIPHAESPGSRPLSTLPQPLSLVCPSLLHRHPSAGHLLHALVTKAREELGLAITSNRLLPCREQPLFLALLVRASLFLSMNHRRLPLSHERIRRPSVPPTQ